jgi:DNA-binding MarR family transcriptional regulator/uncharacterized protein (UPF0335 family)
MTPITRHHRHNELEAAALAYAAQGLYVVPLHEPMFDNAGNLTGCTCEAYKRSKKYFEWLRAKGLEKKFDPSFKCRTPGKHPRLGDWETQASKDPAQIRAWWQKWPTANLGLAVGKSGLVTFDLDSYKEVYGDDGDLFTLAAKQTVTQLSGRGGEHLFYRTDKAYTNANNTLPPGIDIRGAGGMVVLAPSIHPCGNQYQWEDGYSIFEYEPKPLPAALAAILDAAQQNSAPAALAKFTAVTTERPDLIRWRLSKAVRELINAPGCVGTRSENDMKVVTALVYAGATPDDILAVFQHYPIGTQGKYAESGDEYLARTIGKAQAFAELHPRPDVSATVANLRLWVRTHNFSEYRSELLTKRIDRETGKETLVYLTDSTDTKTADAVLDIMREVGGLTVNVGKKRLAKLAGVGSCNTALKALARLHGWLFDVTIDPIHGTQVSLCDQGLLHRIDPLLASAIVFKRDQSCAIISSSTPENNEYSPRKADEPFLVGTSKTVREHIQAIAQALDIDPAQAKAEYTFAGLGESSLRIIDAMMRAGDMTAAELAQETGKKVSAIRTAVRKLVQHGIVETEQLPLRGCPKVYSLAPDIWQRVEEVAPNLRTYGLVSRRENKRLEAAQQWCKKGIQEAQTAQHIEQAQRLEQRFAKLAKQRTTHLARLHPDLSTKDIERLAYEVAAYKRSPETAATVRTYRTQETAEHRDTVRMIRELADSFSDIDTPKEEVYKAIMQFGTFDEKLVRSVLQSPKQMRNYETLPDIRKRLAHDELMTGVQMPPATRGHAQPVLIGGAA